MKGSLFVGRIAGIKVFIHWTFFAFLVWILFSETGDGKPLAGALWYILLLLSVFACVLMHEYGHALTARRFGIATRNITLLPIGGVASIERMPEKPIQEFLVSVAGPAVNVVIAGLILAGLLLTGNMPGRSFFSETTDMIGAANFFPTLFAVNLSLVIFNLLPAFPMDGGRVLRSLLSMKMDREKATRIAASLGQLCAIGFVILGFYYSPMLIFIGVFIFFGAQMEARQVQTASTLAHFTAGDAVIPAFTEIAATDTLAFALKKLLETQEREFMVMHTGQVVGMLGRNELLKALAMHDTTEQVASVMRKDVVFLDAATPLDRALETLHLKNFSALPVMHNNRLIGILELENVAEFMVVQGLLSKKKF